MRYFIFLSLLVIFCGCNPVNPPSNGFEEVNKPEVEWFLQEVFMAEMEGSTPTDNTIGITWKGLYVESIVYDRFEYTISKDVSDEDIIKKLTLSASSRTLERLVNDGITDEIFNIDAKPETKYEVVSLATNVNGEKILCRDTITTRDKLPNMFKQDVRLADKHWEEEFITNNTIVASYYGDYVDDIKNEIFLFSESSTISDEDIVEMLTHEFTWDEWVETINPSVAGGCHMYYPDLEYETTYEVVAYATFRDGTDILLRDRITTGKKE